jgi:hypothetical protein
LWAAGVQARVVTTDLITLLTELYVHIDDYLAGMVRAGRPPRLTDSELLTLATAQVMLGVTGLSLRHRAVVELHLTDCAHGGERAAPRR